MLLVGLAYVVNETLDRAMLKSILFNQYLENGDAKNSSQALSMARIFAIEIIKDELLFLKLLD